MPRTFTELSRLLFLPPRAAISAGSWLLVLSAIMVATALYWLSPGQEWFERWFSLPPAPVIAEEWRPWIKMLRNTYPDFAWALLIGCAARDLIWALRWRLPSLLVLCAATGWELGQWLYFLPGHFDLVDLALSAAAGGIALVVPSQGDVP